MKLLIYEVIYGAASRSTFHNDLKKNQSIIYIYIYIYMYILSIHCWSNDGRICQIQM